MVQQSFHDRLARINQASGQVQMLSGTGEIGGPRRMAQDIAPKRPGLFRLISVGVLMVPVGMAIALLTKVFLDPEITPEAVHYLPLLGIVAVSHLAMAGGAIGAVAARFQRVTLNYALLFVFAGYGLASAALSAAVG